MTEIPKSIHYRGIDWPIVERNELLQAERRWGATNFGEHEVQLDTSKHDTHIRQTLLHEILHMATEAFPEGDPSEMTISQMAYNLFGLLQDNPQLRDYLWRSES